MREAEVERCGAEELAAFVALLEEVGAWLWARGVRQWAPGEMRAQLPALESDLASGALLVARRAGALAGGCVVTTRATPEWQARGGAAGYVQKLAVARPEAGRGLGARLLEEAASWARERGLPALRLDCWDGNATLRAYYRSRGFAEGDAVASKGYAVRLFERRC